MHKKVNFLYEFKGPNGYIPIGFDYKQIGVIFDVLNNKEWDGSIYSNRCGYDGYFKLLDESASAYDFLNMEREYVQNKCVYELTKDDIENCTNVFVIDSMHNESIVDYVKTVDFTNIISDKTKELFIQNNFKILVIDNKEGAYYHDYEFFSGFKRLHEHLNITTENQIFYITNSSDILEKYRTYLFHTKQESFMKVKNIEFLIYDAGEPIVSYFDLTGGESKGVIYEQDVDYSLPLPHELGEKREKHFLSMNRNTGRLHRPKLVLNMIKEDVFDKGLVSLLQSDVFDEWAERPGNEEYKTLIKDKYPFVIDYEDERFVSGMHNFFTEKDMWMKTYFSVVSETSSSDRWIFITEKVIRPMIYYHPFILWGNPGTLEVLQKHGFETFPELFDESYDMIYNEELRLKSIMKSVKRLCDMPLEELHELYKSVMPKLIHNRELLTKFYYEQTRNKTIINLLTDEG
jgi:hypothetical protein